MAKKRSKAASDPNSNPAASFKYEVILWAVLALSIILFISNFGIAGAAGNFISSLFFGMFGMTAYIFPILLFAGTAFVIANQDNTAAMVKAAAALGFFIFVCMFLELVSGSADSRTPLDAWLWSAEHKFGGGLCGGILTWLVRPHLGTISAYVIDVIMLIICLVLVTQRSLWKPIQSGSRKVYASAKNETIRQRQQYQERRQRRIDNKVSGVSHDTSLKQTSSPSASDNVSEIRPDPALLQDFPIYMMNQPLPKPTGTKSREEKPKQQEEQQMQQNLAAVGMGYPQMPPVQEQLSASLKKAGSESGMFEKIIPITNRKVTLQPNASDFMPQTNAAAMESHPAQQDSAVTAESADSIHAGEPEDDFLARSNDIFSELLPGADHHNWDGVNVEQLGDAADLGNGMQMDDACDPVTEMHTDHAWDSVSGDGQTGDAWDSVSGDGQTDDVWRPANENLIHNAGADVLLDRNDGASADAMQTDVSGHTGAVSAFGRQKGAAEGTDWNIVPDTLFAEEFPDASALEEDDADGPPLSAEELMDQQLREAAALPKRVSAVAPVTQSDQTASASGQAQAAPKPASGVLHKQPKQSAAEAQSGAVQVQMQMAQAAPKIKREYILPPVDLLKCADMKLTGDTREHLQETALKLQQTLKNFGVNVTILNVSCGPSVTRYEIQPEMGVKVSKIVNLADDIKLNLAAADIRIEAPIPGKAAIGIEVPNKETVPVMFRDLIESEDFRKQTSPCAFAAGKDISGQVVVTDICKMPHLLIAGATGSGKSVCINTIIMSIIYKADPDDVKLIMIDPKVVELSVYNGIPHLLLPVVTDPKKAAGALHWAVSEMMDRYQKFSDYGVRNMKGYNAKIQKIADLPDENKPQKMPYIVIIVDELADLMMAAPGDVEDAICRLAQLARAAGIHLIIATQRPSVNVITGLIKANMPSRIAFSVTSGIDSRTILDMNGAEKLLGKGDMLFYPQGFQKPVRVQGAFVSDAEVSDVVEFLTERNGMSEYDSAIEQQVVNASAGSGASGGDASAADERDVYFTDAARLLIDKEKASVSMLQRYFKIGFNRAARIMDQLEEAGVVGPEEGTKPRKIMMSPEEFAQYEEEVL